jgi:dTMP kinase
VEELSRAAGRFIVLEGPDGAGKSVATADLVAHLRGLGHPVTATREPGGTALGELIRGVLLDPGAVDRSPQADALLFSAARSQLVHEVIRPALERGDVVVSDRFAPSTLAYQGYGGGLDVELLLGLERMATGGLRPDLIVLLDVPVELGLARRRGGNVADLTRFEDESRHDTAFHQRVREGYRQLATAEPDRWRIVDGSRTRSDVEADVRQVVTRFLVGSEPMAPLARMGL